MAVRVESDGKKKPKVTKYNKGEGIGGFFGEIGNFFIDNARDSGNTLSGIGDTLASRKWDTTRAGDRAFGVRPQPKPLPKAGPIAGPDQNLRTGGVLQPEEPTEMSFADYLKMANELSTGNGVDYSALIAQMQGNAAQGDARLNAMYSQLQKSIEGDAAGIAAVHDTAVSDQNANADEAAAVTTQGYNAARDAQTKQLAALGIGDAAAVLAAQGGNAARDQAVANSNIQQNKVANTNQTTANRASALTYNTRVGQAAGAEGASQRATLQQTLANKLAEIQMEQSRANAGQQNQNWERAAFLADWDNAAAQRRQGPSAMDELEMQKLAQEITGMSLKNENYAAAMGGGQTDPAQQYAQMQSIAQQFGIDPANQEAMGEFIKQLAASQKIK